MQKLFVSVSIPNGDRHYLEPYLRYLNNYGIATFQSPMGIGITSNAHTPMAKWRGYPLFQSPMGIGITSNGRIAMFGAQKGGFNPQWG